MSEPPVAERQDPGRTARLHAALWTRLAIGIVVAVGGTLVLVKVVGSSAGAKPAIAHTPTSTAVLAEVTSVPEAVFDRVKVASPTVPIVAPTRLVGADALLAHDHGAAVPVVLFVGAEYCSFCAAERWPLIVALSRFGTFTRLYDVASSSIDFAPDTPTFSFLAVRYHSPYLVFRPYEVASDVLGPHGYVRLERLPGSMAAAAHRADPNATLPVVVVGNAAVARQAAFSPITFAGVSREQIAAALTDPASPLTQSIVASANYLTAAICHTDRERPGSVCASPGVVAADRALGFPA